MALKAGCHWEGGAFRLGEACEALEAVKSSAKRGDVQDSDATADDLDLRDGSLLEEPLKEV